MRDIAWPGTITGRIISSGQAPISVVLPVTEPPPIVVLIPDASSYDRLLGATKPLLPKPYLADGVYRLGMNFPITGLNGKVISTGNYLEITSATKVAETAPQAARFLGKDLNGDHLGSICAGFPTNFSYGGHYAHGNRVLITSHTHLYCIGDPSKPYNGKPSF